MKTKLLLISTLLTALILAGCAQNISPNNYNVQNVGEVSQVIKGVIVAERPVKVSGNNNGVGGLAGAVAGGAAGSAIGSGARANIIGAVGGALAGGLLGNVIQKKVSSQTGIEYVIKPTRGHLLSIVQGAQTDLYVGQHVLVIMGNPARIIPDHTYYRK